MPQRRSSLLSWIVAGDPDPLPVAVASPAATPSAQGENAAGHVLVQVGEDLVANPPPYDISIKANDSVVSATALGEYDGEYLCGVLTANDQVYFSVANPSENTSHGQIESYDEFAADGITLDGDKWSVTWFADGTVVWDVI